ncbi:sphingosine-1-phosphate phosphatase 2-like [Babylonia areolata]|uniref:sphingosine-1-phosphate phosphatase 2-like n=1 Tax=Babylonia areolata TaxID=304850 RepID=UPI003FCF9CC6
MSRLWRRIIALSDSQLTADFQRLCGIRSVKKYEQNGVDKSQTSVPSLNVNGFTEECHELQNLNGDSHPVQNGNARFQNGTTDSCQSPLKKVHGHKNGFVTHSEQNGGKTVYQQNGTACQCQHESLRPRVNGYIHNGDACKSGTHDTVETSKTSNQNSSYVIENKLLYYIFSFGASLGNEIFYILFFSIGLWAFDSYVSRKTSVVWCVIMYVGQAAKDLICWPRPASPPTVRLEGRYELEYGMPSTHAMVGVVIPFGLLYYTYGYYEYNLFLGTLVAVVWCVLVSFSRLYLGMHSVLDILVGIVCAFIMMAMTIPFVDMIDCLLIAHPWCFPVLNLVIIGLCLAYPELKVWSTARGDTTQVLAVFGGIYQGLWYTGQVTTPEMAAAAALSAHSGWAAVAAGFGRQLLGVVVLVFLLESLKKLVVFIMATLLGLDPKDPRSKQHLWVELPYKYVGYFTPAFFASYIMPRLFQYLGWHRRNYLLEILNYSHYFGL